MRKPRINELWDRTPGGVIVPRQARLPTRRFIQKMGTVQCCCTTTPTPDDVCPVCAESTVGGASVSFSDNVCTVAAGTYFVANDPTYAEGPPAYCTWQSLTTPPTIIVTIYATGRIDVSISVGGQVVGYRKEHFTGDPPFDCRLEDVEIPYLYKAWLGCSTYAASVFLST